MTVLIVHEVGYRKKVVFEFHNIAEILAARGHRVIVVAFEDHWERESALDWGHLRTRVTPGVSRTGVGGGVTLVEPGFLKILGISRIVFLVTSALALRRIFRQERVDRVLLYAVPTFGWVATILARRFRVPVFFRSIDILHRLTPYAPLRAPTKLLERFVYRRVDRIIALTPMLGQYTVKLGANPGSISYIAPGVDTSLFRPSPPDEALRTRWGIRPDESVLLFIGTLFPFSGLDDVIGRFAAFHQQHPSTRLLIVGGGPQLALLRALVQRQKLERLITFTDYQPYVDMPRYISLATICFNSFRLGPVTREIIPSKLIQYLAGGKPLVATPLPGTQDLLPGEAQGVVYADLGEPFMAALAALLHAPDRREELGRRAAAFVRERHGWDRIADQYEAVMDLRR